MELLPQTRSSTRGSNPKPIKGKRALRRIIAPYVTIKRSKKKEAEKEEKGFLLKRPSLLLKDLTGFLSDAVDLTTLLHESAEVLKMSTKANCASLYMVDADHNEIYQIQRHFDIPSARMRWKIEEGTFLAAHVACKKEFVMIEDIYLDERFPQEMCSRDELVKSVLCVPIVTPDGDIFAVIEMTRDLTQPPFTRDDLKITVVVTGWMGAAIHQNQQRLALKKQQELNDYLLDLTKCYFEDNVLIDKMITEIVKFAKATLSAERGSFFILDYSGEELTAELFEEGCEQDHDLLKKNQKIKFGKERGIAGQVARTGVMLNIKDAYNDPRFSKEIDQKTGFITRSILCMPVMGNGSNILGIVQVVNKKNGGYFTTSDENLFKTFSLYCSLALHYSQLSKHTEKLEKKRMVLEQLLQRQVKPCIHDANNFAKNPRVKVPSAFSEFKWYILPELLDDMPQLVFYMFHELFGENCMEFPTIYNFLLSCRKLYRNNPYHNFEHAFTVCHCMYNILLRNSKHFSVLEIKALMVATICHDIDHGGFTNNYLVITDDLLVQLYDESPWENHHYYVTITLLADYQIFNDLSPENYKVFCREIKEAIIATDLSLYFKCRLRLMQIVNEGSFDFENNYHRILLKSMAMTVCDLSGQCKPYSVTKKVTENVYREFYNQGDNEKKMGSCPLSMMDREKSIQIPQDQVNFLTVVVLPATDLLKSIFPNTGDLSFECTNLRKTWQEIIDLRDQKVWRPDDSVVDEKKD